MSVKKLLIIDDDRALTDLLVEYLTPHGYDIDVAHDGGAGLSAATSRDDVDVILLDVMMPVLDGFDVLKQLRQVKMTPVIMLTARGDDYDRVLGLEMGADDYLPKPFNHRELSARIKALIRRAELSSVAQKQHDLILGPLRLSQSQQQAFVEGRLLPLTGTEFLLLKLLMAHAGELISKASISEHVLGRRLAAFDRSIDMHVSNLRRKLSSEGAQEMIATVRGSGYILRIPLA
ncbi:response regulator [Alteromonas oceanisediminis]|uniref:response regulator n=1 Tax=Alteromonas oceanisediminis TaxID=2836180 RepID=UPI001BDAD6FD|nr:response regulator [Alteromonas oceanisediminis]MBT0586075.1 response regulator [Alteromonas oceanisediminis]